MKNFKSVLRGFYSEQKNALIKIASQLPEDIRAKLDPLKAQLDLTLASLNDSANDASGDQTDIAVPNSIQPLVEIISDFNVKYAAMQAQLASLDTKVQDGITAKVKAGDLVPKEVVEQRINEATKAVTDRANLVSSRRNALMTASIPQPANDEVLVVEDFDGKLATAKKRITELQGKGITAQATLASLSWASDEDYKARVALIDEAQKATKGKPDLVAFSTQRVPQSATNDLPVMF